MRKIFIANMDELLSFSKTIQNDNNYVFNVFNNNIIVSLCNNGKLYEQIKIDIQNIDSIPYIDILEKYSIINELLLPYEFGLRCSKKEI